jgi:transcriptional regulator with XRE-family HTH domain
MSLSEVAGAVGVSTATLSRIETEKQSVNVTLLVRISQVLHVSASDMLATQDEATHDEDVLVAALAALPSDERARVIAAAAKHHRPAKRAAELQSRVETLLATVDVIREQLADLGRHTRRRR